MSDLIEEKTLGEVIIDLLKRNFRIIFGHIEESPIESVFVKFKKRNCEMTRIIETEFLTYGLLFWAEEFDKELEKVGR